MITVSNIDNLAFIFFPPQIFWYKFRRWSFYHQAMLEKKQKARTLGSSLGGQNLITTPSCSNRNQFGVIDIITTRKSPKPSNKWVHQEGRIWWRCNDGGPREHASKKLNFLSFFFLMHLFLETALLLRHIFHEWSSLLSGLSVVMETWGLRGQKRWEWGERSSRWGVKQLSADRQWEGNGIYSHSYRFTLHLFICLNDSGPQLKWT